MGHTTAVAGIPASRQKNCNACVQAKRRCDRRTPICSRCVEKKIACVYGKIQAAISSQPRNESIEVAPYMESLPFGSSACSLFSPDLSLDVDYLGVMPMDSQPDAATAESLHTSVMDAASNGDTPMDPFMRLFDSSITANKHQWLVPTDHGPMTDRPSSPADEGTRMAYQKMACFCVSPAPPSFSVATSIFTVLAIVLHMSSDATSHSFYPGLS